MSTDLTEFDVTDGTPPVMDLSNLYRSRLDLRMELDKLVRETGYGNLSSMHHLTMKGFNYLRRGQPMVLNTRDNMGFTFFTRPILNLTYDNLSNVDSLVSLRNAPENSIPSYVRATLDPWSHTGKYSKTILNTGDQKNIARYNAVFHNRMVDECNPFIPLLSNTLVNMSGWKDIQINDYTSKAGVHNEQWAMADGFYYNTGAFEMSSSFRNIEGDPISLLFQVWLHYMIACRQEYTMNPYPVFVEDREFDYNTANYRFITDNTRTYVRKFAKTIMFPMSLSSGNQFNFSSDSNFIDVNHEVTVTWKCIGAEYNEPAILDDFNRLVAMYTPGLRIRYDQYDKATESLIVEDMDTWVKLKPDEKLRGLYLAIPLINYITYELEWWIRRTDYDEFVAYTKDKPPMYGPTYSGNNNRVSSRLS